jgi:hypothetical protein
VTDPQPRPTPGSWAAGRPAVSAPVPGPPVPGPPVPGPPVPGPPASAATSPAAGGVQPVTGGTGDVRVDAALARLDRLDDLPVADHVGEYDAVHRALQDALTAIDES